MFSASVDTSLYHFGLSHPKNYLGVPLAVAADGPTEILVPQHLVKMAGEAGHGAEDLGLVTRHNRLTERGQIIVDEADVHYETPEDALIALADQPRTRFISAHPEFVEVAQAVFGSYHPIQPIISVLDDEGPLTLAELVTSLSSSHPQAFSETFLTPSSICDETPIESLKSTERPVWLSEPSSFHALTTFQLKSLLCHVGILTTPGSDTSSLVPDEDLWGLSDRLSDTVRELAVAAVDGGGE